MEHFMLVLGQNEFILRFMPACFGILTIPVFYLIGREFADKDVGIIMAALLTFSPFHIFYSQDARSYSTLLFLFSLALFFFLFSLRTNDVRTWILFGFFSALSLWTHYYIVIPLALLFAYALFWEILHGRNTVKQLLPYAFSSVTFILVCLPLVPLAVNLFFKRISIPPHWGVKGIDVFYQTFNALSEYHRSTMALFCVLFVIGIVSLGKTDKSKTIFIVGLLTIPLLVSVYLAEKMPMNARHLIYLLPFFFLGIAISLESLARMVRHKNFFVILLVIFFLIQAPFLLVTYNVYYSKYSKEDWRGIATIIKDTTVKGDYIIVIPNSTRVALDNYYSNTTDGTYEFGARNVSEIKQITSRSNNNHIFLVMTGYVTYADPTGNTLPWVKNNTRWIGSMQEIDLYALNASTKFPG
jgi:uncharacterized membrane protein